jgi:hypothetical protein
MPAKLPRTAIHNSQRMPVSARGKPKTVTNRIGHAPSNLAQVVILQQIKKKERRARPHSQSSLPRA